MENATDVVPRFRGKVVLVTGSSRNCGLEIADLFLREGAKVYTCGSSQTSTEKGAAALRARGLDNFTAVACNIEIGRAHV